MLFSVVFVCKVSQIDALAPKKQLNPFTTGVPHMRHTGKKNCWASCRCEAGSDPLQDMWVNILFKSNFVSFLSTGKDQQHNNYIFSTEDEGIDVVTFLYQLTSGSAGQSYGLNVARLAQIPHSILRRAAEKSKHLENICKMRRKGKEIFKKIASDNNEKTRELLQELRSEGI
nr:DNA mismatch repair protein MSH3-like [Penaeus vannamei]